MEKMIKRPEIDLHSYSHLKVLNNRIMVKEVKINYEMTSGGIMLNPTSSKERFSFTQGVVVKVGEGAILPSGEMLKPTVEVGDVVYFSDASGVDFKVIRGGDESLGTLDFEDVRVVDIASVYYVDGAAKQNVYIDVTK